MWMPPHTTTPPGATARSAAGTSAPTGAKISAASSGSGGASSDPPAQTAPRRRAKSCAAWSPGAGEGEHLPPLPTRHLDRDMRRGTEAVQPEPPRLARHAEGAVADQPGAHQRRGGDIGEAGRDGEAEARVGDGMVGKAAVDLAAGEPGARAKISRPVMQYAQVPQPRCSWCARRGRIAPVLARAGASPWICRGAGPEPAVVQRAGDRDCHLGVPFRYALAGPARVTPGAAGSVPRVAPAFGSAAAPCPLSIRQKGLPNTETTASTAMTRADSMARSLLWWSLRAREQARQKRHRHYEEAHCPAARRRTRIQPGRLGRAQGSRPEMARRGPEDGGQRRKDRFHPERRPREPPEGVGRQEWVSVKATKTATGYNIEVSRTLAQQ